MILQLGSDEVEVMVLFLAGHFKVVCDGGGFLGGLMHTEMSSLPVAGGKILLS